MYNVKSETLITNDWLKTKRHEKALNLEQTNLKVILL